MKKFNKILSIALAGAMGIGTIYTYVHAMTNQNNKEDIALYLNPQKNITMEESDVIEDLEDLEDLNALDGEMIELEQNEWGEFRDFKNMYELKRGEITSVVQGSETVSITVKADGKEIIFNTDEDVFVYNHLSKKNSDVNGLVKGMQIYVVVSKDAPQLLIEPLQINDIAGIVIVDDNVELELALIDNDLSEVNGKFRVDAHSQAKVLDILDSEEPLGIEDVRMSESLIIKHKYEEAVTYKKQKGTKNILQLGEAVEPEAIIILNDYQNLGYYSHSVDIPSWEKLIENSNYEPLEEIALQKGYTVEQEGDKIILQKDDIQITLTLNSKKLDYTHMTFDLHPLDSVEELDLAPKMENSQIMVSGAFLDSLK